MHFFRSEVNQILTDAHTELQSLKLSEISLNVSKDTEDNAVSLDMQEQLFDAISTSYFLVAKLISKMDLKTFLYKVLSPALKDFKMHMPNFKMDFK